MTSHNSKNSHKVSCHCNRVSFDYIVPGPPDLLPVYLCHCTSCRHFLGSLMLPMVIHIPPSPASTWSPPPGVLDGLTECVFSNKLKYYSCPDCGARILCHIAPPGRDPLWGLMTGVIEAPSGQLKVMAHEHVTDTVDGGMADAIVRYNGAQIPRWPHGWGSGNLPAPNGWRWDSHTQTQARGDTAKTLSAHCKCGQVKFEFRRHEGERFLAQLCACNICNQTTGLEVMPWMRVPAERIVDEQGAFRSLSTWKALKTYAATPKWIRYRCATCGAMVAMTSQEATESVSVAMGVLDAPEGARAEDWAKWRTDGLQGEEDATQRHPEFLEALKASMGKKGV